MLLTPCQRTTAEWQAIREIISRALLANEERGTSATGLALLGANGEAVLEKKAVRASEFIKTPEYQSILGKINEQTTLILGHTRLPTKGDPASSNNNHPICIDPVIGVHNGHINNDDALFEKFGFRRQAEVDSEIIFHMLGTIDPRSSNPEFIRGARNCIQLLDGQFTFMACDKRRPEQLLVVRHNNPLWHYYERELHALIFSSRYIFLRTEFRVSSLTHELRNNYLALFNAHELPRLKSQPEEAASF